MSDEKKIEIGREYRFAWHIPAANRDEDDYHFVKEQVHYKQGDKEWTEPTLRLIKNFTRPIWFTKPNLRVHKDRREFERLENLNREDVRQSDLKAAIARQLNGGYANPRSGIRDLVAKPYCYGGDVPSTLFLREQNYVSKWPTLNSERTVAMFDTEADVVHGTDEIIIATTCFKNKALAVIQRSFLEGFSNCEELFQQYATKHLKKYIEERNLEIQFVIADSEIDVIKVSFAQIHAWRPDFLAIWNINYDIPKIMQACERAGVDPADILCDPGVPKHLRLCKYKEGITKKESASGVKMTIKPANQWHVLELTASFFVVCAMASYRRIRGGPELPSYALDNTLKREKIGDGKINIPEAEKYHKLKWHQFMQTMRKFDYICYAIFDSYSMTLMDEKTKDLRFQLPLLADNTSFSDYSSQSKRQRDNFFLFGLANGLVLGTAGPIAKKKQVFVKRKRLSDDDFDGEEEETNSDGEPTTLDTKNWVITLRAFMAAPGLRIIEEDGSISTLVRTHVYDNDVVSSYPNCIFVANVSKYTTILEVTGMTWSDGPIPETTYRMQNLNFVFGRTNHAEYYQVMHRGPTYPQLREMKLADLAKKKAAELEQKKKEEEFM